MPMPMCSVHALKTPSRAGLAVSRSELVKPGEVTCAFRGMAGAEFKKRRTHVLQIQKKKYHNDFFSSGKNSAERGLSKLADRMCTM